MNNTVKLAKNVANKILNNYQDVEDIIQTVELKRIESGFNNSCFVTAVRNLSLNEIRRKRTVKINEKGILLILQLRDMLDPLLQDLENELDKLKKEEKELLDLKFYQCMPRSKIAKKLGITEPTVTNRTKVILKKLKRRMER